MQYLVGQMLTCLLGAGLLGLAIGFMWWGMRLRRTREHAADLEQRLSKLTGYPARLTDLEATHAAYVASKNEEAAKCKARIAELEPLAAQVPVLTAELEEKDAQIADLTSQVEQHAAALAEKDSRLEDLTAQVERPVAAAHAERDEHVSELVAAAASSTDLRSRLESAEYESSLATRKLRMAEAAAAARETEIAKLHDRILMHEAEMESVKRDQAKAVPLKAMAAAAGASASGFYDVNEGAATQVATPAAPQDHVREFEKRIEELRNVESSKDAEIAKLRSKVADVEAAPDPDTRRQILFAAKNAELTHLRGVLNSLFQPVSQDEVATRAYFYAQDRGFAGGSPMEDWLRAERDSHYHRLAYAWESTRSGTMF